MLLGKDGNGSDRQLAMGGHYQVNIATLDEQHQRLFDIVNELERALSTGNGMAAIDAVLNDLAGYIADHFVAPRSP